MQECIRPHVDPNLIGGLLDSDRLQVAPRMGRLAVDGAEGAEVVLADQGLRGGVHGAHIERANAPR